MKWYRAFTFLFTSVATGLAAAFVVLAASAWPMFRLLSSPQIHREYRCVFYRVLVLIGVYIAVAAVLFGIRQRAIESFHQFVGTLFRPRPRNVEAARRIAVEQLGAEAVMGRVLDAVGLG